MFEWWRRGAERARDLNVVTPMVRLLAPVGMAYSQLQTLSGLHLTISRRANRDADRRRRRATQASGVVRGALGWTAVADRGESQDRHSTIIFCPSPDPNETITRSAGRVMLMAVRLPMSSSQCA